MKKILLIKEKTFKKRGQIGGQIFIYIMAVVIIGAIGLLGYQSIASILSKSCQAEMLGFGTEINRLISKYNSPNSINKDDMLAPCDYQTICFLDSNTIETNPSIINCSANTIVQSSGRASNKQNIFLITPTKTTPMGYADVLTTAIPGNCTCISAKSNTFKFKFIGHGITTEVQPG